MPLQSIIESDLPVPTVVAALLEALPDPTRPPEYFGQEFLELCIYAVGGKNWEGWIQIGDAEKRQIWNMPFGYQFRIGLPLLYISWFVRPGHWRWVDGKMYLMKPPDNLTRRFFPRAKLPSSMGRR